ncbi:biotin-dependent carboxyltransferase family protein [Streptosporangium pseudovulgare]|uniref:Allophanate hydrolase n=1 Tax=Streptosporangium pseudovulgare TaxID=35765 RepID=A0ABQ2QL46_9ACTN|nr:biotin-dependent carboxyltransferase family protein [Streptosporangium pseudovulgare]GGP85554.1 allophanate hydrolase [Streptosporangium pseudovulgare]
MNPEADPVLRVVEVVAPGPYATVQDLGRPGHGHLGVPCSGAADAPSLRLANRLVGNPEDAAGIELTFGGARLRFPAGAWVAVTGAPCPLTLRVPEGAGGSGGTGPSAVSRGSGSRDTGSPAAGSRRDAARAPARPGAAGPYAPVWVPSGGELRVGAPTAGLRTYVAVRGGLDVPAVLGSRSTDALSGLGPAPLAPGLRLPLGPAAGLPPIVVDAAPPPPIPRGVLRVLPGPRDDWFAPDALEALCAAPYQVSRRSNRVGVRLAGTALRRVRDGELPSEGMVAGAVQVPPSGQPIVFLADHPPTGGYPVIAVVASADLAVAAQLRPGDPVWFRLR